MARRTAATLALLMMTAATLSWVAPAPAAVLSALRHPQEWVGMHGADVAILTMTVGVCWLLLGWLGLAVAIGLAGRLPGVAGRVARVLATLVLPRVLRQTAALALGVGLVTAGGSAAADPGPVRPPVSGAAVDWPIQPPSAPAPPNVPPPVCGGPPVGDPIDGVVVVEAGDTLWAIAAGHRSPGSTPDQIVAAVTEWYETNRAVIGADPDLIYPGQRLMPPRAGS